MSALPDSLRPPGLFRYSNMVSSQPSHDLGACEQPTLPSTHSADTILTQSPLQSFTTEEEETINATFDLGSSALPGFAEHQQHNSIIADFLAALHASIDGHILPAANNPCASQVVHVDAAGATVTNANVDVCLDAFLASSSAKPWRNNSDIQDEDAHIGRSKILLESHAQENGGLEIYSLPTGNYKISNFFQPTAINDEGSLQFSTSANTQGHSPSQSMAIQAFLRHYKDDDGDNFDRTHEIDFKDESSGAKPAHANFDADIFQTYSVLGHARFSQADFEAEFCLTRSNYAEVPITPDISKYKVALQAQPHLPHTKSPAECKRERLESLTASTRAMFFQATDKIDTIDEAAFQASQFFGGFNPGLHEPAIVPQSSSSLMPCFYSMEDAEIQLPIPINGHDKHLIIGYSASKTTSYPHKSVTTIIDNHDTDPTLWQGNVSSYGSTLHLGYFLQHAVPKACNTNTKKLADPTQLFMMFLFSPLRGRISNGQGREKCNEAPTYQEFCQVKTDPKPTARVKKKSKILLFYVMKAQLDPG